MFIPPTLSPIQWGDKGSSAKFRSISDFVEQYATDMNSNNWRKCELFRKKYEELEDEIRTIKKEYGVSERRFSIWDKDYDPDFSNIAEEDDDLEPDQRDHIEDLESDLFSLNQQISLYYDYYPQILFQSLFVTIYALFEKYLTDICNRLRNDGSLTLKLRDLHNDRNIKKAAQYIKKVARIDFPDDRKEWADIIRLGDLRNSIVHIPSDQKFDRHDVRHDKKLVGLLDYIWLYDDEEEEEDNFWWDVTGKSQKDIMFSFGSIRNVIHTFKSFTIIFDEVFEKHRKRREKFQRGPKGKK